MQRKTIEGRKGCGIKTASFLVVKEFQKELLYFDEECKNTYIQILNITIELKCKREYFHK